MRHITAEYFKERTGREPQDDDLQRCNCDKARQLGHMQCGWCERCDLPRFICGHKLKFKIGDDVHILCGDMTGNIVVADLLIDPYYEVKITQGNGEFKEGERYAFLEEHMELVNLNQLNGEEN